MCGNVNDMRVFDLPEIKGPGALSIKQPALLRNLDPGIQNMQGDELLGTALSFPRPPKLLGIFQEVVWKAAPTERRRRCFNPPESAAMMVICCVSGNSCLGGTRDGAKSALLRLQEGDYSPAELTEALLLIRVSARARQRGHDTLARPSSGTWAQIGFPVL